MENNVDVYRNMLDLAETTLEGLEHINTLIIEGRFEETVVLYTDVTSSVHEMKKALLAIWPDFDERELGIKSEKVIEAMKMMLAAYEGERDARPMEIMQFSLLPAYRRFYKTLQQELGEQCASAYHWHRLGNG